MTKIISGNEIPTQRERLNPKIFARERRLQFNGADLEDNESRSVISLADFKKKIKNSFTYSAKLKRFDEIKANCSKHNLLINKQNAFISYFREGIDRYVAINNILRFSIDDVKMDDENHIHFNVTININPYKEIIGKYSENEEIQALYTKLFNFYGEDQSVIKITDNEIRREETYNVGQFTITRDELNKKLYKGSKSLIISTENQRFKYNLSFTFQYEEDKDKMSISVDNYELVGLYLQTNEKNIFVAQRPIIKSNDYKTIVLNANEIFVNEEIVNPKIDCKGFKSIRYINTTPSYILEGEDAVSHYKGIDKIIFWNLDGYSYIKELTERERAGIDEIEIPVGCDHFEYVYSNDEVNYDEKKDYYKHISFLMYYKDSNYEFEFYCLAKDCKVYNLCDSFEHFDSFDCNEVLVRNISNIETDIEILSYNYDFNMDYSSTQENYIK